MMRHWDYEEKKAKRDKWGCAMLNGFVWALAALLVGSTAMIIVDKIDKDVKCKLDIVREK